MSPRGIALAILCISIPFGLPPDLTAQASETARAEIQRSLVAEQGAARIDLPFGGEGVQLSELGQVDAKKLANQLKKNGKSIQTGRIVAVTKIEFGKNTIDFELDGGGKDKKNLLGNLEVSVGAGGPPVSTQKPNAPKAKGSKITLKFAKQVPSDLGPDQLRRLLAPVLDFTKQTLTSSSIESLPTQFQEAVVAREARIGMHEETVLLALGRPDQRSSEKVGGVEQVTWLYRLGSRWTLVTFEDSVVVTVAVH